MASGKLAGFMKPSLNWFLVFVPVSVYLEHFHSQAHLWIFFSACVPIIPLAGLPGTATEHIAEHAGEGIGSLLNATFGNAAELIIALIIPALFHFLRPPHVTFNEAAISLTIAALLIIVYAISLISSLRTHKELFRESVEVPDS